MPISAAAPLGEDAAAPDDEWVVEAAALYADLFRRQREARPPGKAPVEAFFSRMECHPLCTVSITSGRLHLAIADGPAVDLTDAVGDAVQAGAQKEFSA